MPSSDRRVAETSTPGTDSASSTDRPAASRLSRPGQPGTTDCTSPKGNGHVPSARRTVCQRPLFSSIASTCRSPWALHAAATRGVGPGPGPGTTDCTSPKGNGQLPSARRAVCQRPLFSSIATTRRSPYALHADATRGVGPGPGPGTTDCTSPKVNGQLPAARRAVFHTLSLPAALPICRSPWALHAAATRGVGPGPGPGTTDCTSPKGNGQLPSARRAVCQRPL